jgi:hypothetical protein
MPEPPEGKDQRNNGENVCAHPEFKIRGGFLAAMGRKFHLLVFATQL